MSPKTGEMLHLRGNALNKGEPVALPLTQSSMYHLPGAPDGHASYGRVDNPTWVHLEHVLSHLEDAPCLSFPSGMGAISAALFATVQAGSRLLIPSDGYYVTRLLADRFLSNLGVSVIERPTTNFAEGDRKIKSALRGKLARESKLGLLMEVTKMGMPANSPGSHKFRSFE